MPEDGPVAATGDAAHCVVRLYPAIACRSCITPRRGPALTHTCHSTSSLLSKSFKVCHVPCRWEWGRLLTLKSVYAGRCRHQGRDSFVGETLLKAADAAKALYKKSATLLLVLLPDTGGSIFINSTPCYVSVAH